MPFSPLGLCPRAVLVNAASTLDVYAGLPRVDRLAEKKECPVIGGRSLGCHVGTFKSVASARAGAGDEYETAILELRDSGPAAGAPRDSI